jgi:2-polyprenyl-6-methoxyphenol hydroxylase-like FAD-dependent oxidoreductase
MTTEEVPVLIVGGSLVGLSTAAFLGWHGVASLVVERHGSTAIHPRAAVFNQRAIEHYRAIGLEPAIVDVARDQFLQDGAIMAVETLAGREIDWYERSINAGYEELSATRRVFITQDVLEPLLRSRAEELGATMRYGAEVVSLDEDDDGVTAVVRERDGGRERTVRAAYVVAADGSRSPTRNRLGIAMRGRGTFSNSLTIYFRADVAPLLRDRALSVIYVFNERQQGFIRLERAADAGFLAVMTARDESGQRIADVAADPSEERCRAFVRDALGDDDLAVEIENVQAWEASADVAERLSRGRTFLVGDAAHTMPPTGGFGGNTGIHDACNLAWKLAAVVRGVAGERLLETYDAERRPVATFTAEQAYTRYVARLAPDLGTDDLLAFVDDATIDLGYRYRSAAILDEGEDDGAPTVDPRTASALPGTRAPHVRLEREGTEISPVDLIGRGFLLLAGADGARWCAAARGAAARLDVEMAAAAVGAEVADLDGRFGEVYATGSDGAVLVRPDGIVAWRAGACPDDGEDLAASALARALALS